MHLVYLDSEKKKVIILPNGVGSPLAFNILAHVTVWKSNATDKSRVVHHFILASKQLEVNFYDSTK